MSSSRYAVGFSWKSFASTTASEQTTRHGQARPVVRVWLAHNGKACRNSDKEPKQTKMKKTIHVLLASASKTDYRIDRKYERNARAVPISERIAAATDLIGGNDYRAADKPLMFSPFADMLPKVAQLG